MFRKLNVVVFFLIIFFVPSLNYAKSISENRYHEYVYSEFPVSNSTVANANDYYMYMTTSELSDSSDQAVANYLRLDAGWVFPNHFNPFMHAGLYVTSEGVGWFAGTNPGDPSSPTVTCSNPDFEVWPNQDGQPTGCLSSLGNLGLDVNIWTRVQMVNYGNGKWIVRFTNADGYKADVAEIHNPYTTITKARVVMEETWYGTDPNQNPWLSAHFYNLDLKYRTGGGWAFWPSGIRGDYGTNYISEASTSGTDVCPDYYGVNDYVQGNPFLWYMGSGGSKCSGQLYTGGGPDTVTISIVGETTGKFMSSENGTKCIYTDRTIPGSWEEWHVDEIVGDIFAYKGNNAKYLSRRSNDDLWADANDTSSNNAQFIYEEIAPYVFRLKNKKNGRYVDHNSGNSCTEADTLNPGNEEKFRYVSW